MIRAASAAVSAPPPKPHRRAAWLKDAGVGVLALLVSQYLAGWLLLKWLHLDPRSAGPLTIARYGYYYGERADVRPRLWATSLTGLALVGAVSAGALAAAPARAAWGCALCDAPRGRRARGSWASAESCWVAGAGAASCSPANRACVSPRRPAPARARASSSRISSTGRTRSSASTSSARTGRRPRASARASGQDVLSLRSVRGRSAHRALESVLLCLGESRAARE